MRRWFASVSDRVSAAAGSPWAFLVALGVVLAWGVGGPFLDFSDAWMLVINTLTTIVTFLMLFLLQRSQNKDTEEIKILLRQIVRDEPAVDDKAAQAAIDDGC